MKKYMIIAISCMMMSAQVCAQRKQIGDAKTILKSGKNFEQAEKLMTDLLKDSTNKQNVRIYDIWLQAVEKQYLTINEKMYIKEKVDTAAFFNLRHANRGRGFGDRRQRYGGCADDRRERTDQSRLYIRFDRQDRYLRTFHGQRSFTDSRHYDSDSRFG